MGRFGIGELSIILIIIVLLFGAGKLPQLARAIAESLREFKKAAADKHPDDTDTHQQ